MKKIPSRKTSITVNLLIAAMLLSILTIPGFSQERPVVISVGQPNIWSLEQAHYLLARMHRQNLDLQTAPLGSIDPNETNSQRVEIVKMLISAGFSYDEAIGMNNQLLKNDKTFNSQRRQELLEQRTSLQAQRTQLAGEIATLKIEKSKTEDEDAQKVLQQQIEAKTEQKTAVEDNLAKVNDELSGLSSATGNFTGTGTNLEGFDSTKLPTGALGDLLPKAAAKPSIAASQRLENYVGMQYEIIAKQLTLLRDEVGPGERLVFLELPQSINLSQPQEKNKYYGALRGIAGMSTNDSADNKMAQVWWRIDGYTRIDEERLLEAEMKTIKTAIDGLQTGVNSKLVFANYNISRITQKLNELNASITALNGQAARLAALKAIAEADRTPEQKTQIADLEIEVPLIPVKLPVLTGERDRVQAELTRIEGERGARVKELRASQIVLESRIEPIAAQIRPIQTRLDELDAMKRAIEAAGKAVEASKKKHEDLLKNYPKEEEAIETAKKDLELKTKNLEKLRETTPSDDTITTLGAEIVRLKASIEPLEAARTAIIDALVAIRDFRESKENLNGGKTKLQAHVEQLCEIRLGLEKREKEAAAAIKARKDKLNDENKILGPKVKDLEAEKNKPTQKPGEIDRLQALVDAQRAVVSRIEGEIIDLQVNECAKIQTDLDLLNSTISQAREAIQVIETRDIRYDKEEAKLIEDIAALQSKYDKLQIQAERNKIKKQRNAVDRLWQGGSRDNATVVAKTIELLSRNDTEFSKAPRNNLGNDNTGKPIPWTDNEGREYISLTGPYRSKFKSFPPSDQDPGKEPPAGFLRDRSVRVIDVIPRQNAVNVDTTKESVKASGVVAAFSFLFGFGGNVRYQRQKETFDEFISQELYTSGFGKGDTDFGWSFFPFNGSKQLAPGLRTTYAVAIVPEDAETLVLKAQGCYFARREKQPADYDAANYWKRDKESSGCLQREQVFVIPVPGGTSRGSDFYVTEIRYKGGVANGQRAVAVISGQNISPQTGVTIDGVPLVQAVGLAQTGIESILGDKVREVCEGQICGRFERISSSQLVVSFRMPDGFKGTPRISLVAPGKAIEINTLSLNVNGKEDAKLDGEDFMFGKKPGPGAERAITQFRVALDPEIKDGSITLGVVSGKFDEGDLFFINGKLATVEKATADLRIISFKTPKTEQLTITLVPTKGDSISLFISNPSEPRIISTEIVGLVRDGNMATVTVVINGSGFSSPAVVSIDNGEPLDPKKDVLTASPGQLVIRVTTDKAVFAVDILDATNAKKVRTIVTVPPPPEEKEEN